MTVPVVILDTESTGLDAPMRAVELAWIVIDDDMEVMAEHRYLTNPGRSINPGAIAIHGITDEMVANEPSNAEVMAKLPGKVIVVGHNCSYDLRVIGEHIELLAGDLCTLALSRSHIKNTSNHKLATLQAELCLSKQESHTALGDCRTTLELLRYISKLTGKNLRQLIDAAAVPKMVQKMPFGEHKGKAMVDVPVGYRRWLLGKGDDLHRDLRYTLERLKVV
jgi:exodeoxyribonuclease X